MTKKALAIIIISLVFVVFAKQFNSESTIAPAYQTNIDQSVKAFQVNDSSKI